MSDVLSALLHFSDHDYSWLAQFFSLLVLPFAHEDLAIILGAYVVVNEIMPVGLVVLCIYGGMVASDFVLYGIGAGARYLPWLSRLAVDDRVRGFADAFKRNLFALTALCRLVPGVVFVAFIACGWTRVSLARFTVASLVVSALYLPLMLCIVVFFGDALDNRVGLWTWPFLICVLAGIGFLRWRVFAFQEASADAERARAGGAVGNGRPGAAPPHGAVRASALDRVPLALFRLPLVLSWIGFAVRYRSLTLPTVTNPGRSSAGPWGESKSGYLLDVAGSDHRWIADFVTVTRTRGPRTLYTDLERARQCLSASGLSFPLVAKPDISRDGGCRIDDVAQLREYLRHFPAGEKLILQAFVPAGREASVLYARFPGTARGRLIELTLRTGGRCRDGRRHITPELEARIDVIARGMREFHYGRFDLRFASLDALMRGDDFTIVEIGGIGGALDRACDPAMPVAELYRGLIDRQRIMFLIGAKNRTRGFEPPGCADILKSLFLHGQLSRRYPASA
jgi:membrane protein DedA with SNARE-associated domain